MVMRKRFFNNIIENFDINDYLTIEAIENGLKVYFPDGDLMYSIDGMGWKKLVAGAYSPTISKGQTISFKGNLTPGLVGIGTFTVNKDFNLKGNCMSILFGDEGRNNYSLNKKERVFYNLFASCSTLKSVSDNFLPATTLAKQCYHCMFYNCSSLTTAPELPATTLAEGCYESMFSGCTSLTTAPALPATTLANWCYYNMFNSCKSLTTAPALPATTLAKQCYWEMFVNCTNLTTAPELPAMTLKPGCYEDMFAYCTNLTTAPELPAMTLAFACYNTMFQGCTSLTTAPELPATTLAKECYLSMFQGCTSLTTAPELPATTLAESCYNYMFQGCTNLRYIRAMFTTPPSNLYTQDWVSGVASTGKFAKNINATWDVVGVSGVPSGWTVIIVETQIGGGGNIN